LSDDVDTIVKHRATCRRVVQRLTKHITNTSTLHPRDYDTTPAERLLSIHPSPRRVYVFTHATTTLHQQQQSGYYPSITPPCLRLHPRDYSTLHQQSGYYPSITPPCLCLHPRDDTPPAAERLLTIRPSPRRVYVFTHATTTLHQQQQSGYYPSITPPRLCLHKLVLWKWLNISGWFFDVGVYFQLSYTVWWLSSRVVSVLDSGTEEPGFKSKPRHCQAAVLGKLFTPTVPLFTKQQN